jgi:hypothetical protein
MPKKEKTLLLIIKKRQQIKWYGHVIRQREQRITQGFINKKCRNTRPTGQPREQCFGGILEVLGNVTAEDANKKSQFVSHLNALDK